MKKVSRSQIWKLAKRHRLKVYRLSCIVVIGLLLTHFIPPAAQGDQSAEAQVDPDFSKVELVFEPNVGQTDDEVKFLNRAGSTTTYFTPTETVMVNAHSVNSEQEAVNGIDMSTSEVDMDTELELVSDVLRMSLVDANSNPEITGENEVSSKSNYFIGNDSSKWQSDITNYQQVKYSQIYPGIDLVYYGNNKQMEHDFVVAPYTDYTKIAFNLDGAKEIYINDDGDLVVKQEYTDTIFKKPFTYQVSSSSLSRKSDNDSDIEDPDRFSISDSVRVKNDKGESRSGMTNDSNIAEIESSYVLDGNTVKFALADYDQSKPVVIDPYAIEYSTYLGGSGNDNGTYDNEIIVDADGQVFVAGQTASTDFPTSSPYQGSNAGGNDAFIAEFSADGSSLLFSTYFGGSGNDFIDGITLDSSGNIYVTGSTGSSDLPTVNAYQSSFAGGGTDSFVTKIAAGGASLSYSTYLGGAGINEIAHDIAVDLQGKAYITGETAASDFPTSSAYDSSYNGTGDAYVSELSADGLTLLYSTFLGGGNSDFGEAIDIDSDGYIYVVGYTKSNNFPTASPFQASHGGGVRDFFVTKFVPDGSSLVYSTYIGGSGSDVAYKMALDEDGNVYIAGSSGSSNFPTASPYQGSNGGGDDAIVLELNASGSALIFSTYLGGSGSEAGFGISLNSSGEVYVAGYSSSSDFPTKGSYQAANAGGADAFITKFNPAGSTINSSTYLGGAGDDRATGLSAWGDSIYLIGVTTSTDFPTQSAYQGSNAGGQDAFITKLNPGVIISATVDPTLTMSLLCSGGACSSSNNIPESGSLSSGAINTNDNITFQVASNATNGYVIGYNATQTLTSGSNTIDLITGGSGSSPGSEQYGFNLKLNTGPFGAEPSPDTATACQANTITANYGTANAFDYDLKTAGSYQNLVTTTGPTEPCTFTVSHMVNIDTTTQAGEYTNTEIYRVVASY